MTRTKRHFPGIPLWLILGIFLLAISAFSGGQGTTTVTTAGTPVQLLSTSPGTKAVGCTITAASTNTGTIWVGFSSSVSAANKIGTPLGPPITTGQPGASYACMPVGNSATFSLGSIFLDATVSGDKVSFSWF